MCVSMSLFAEDIMFIISVIIQDIIVTIADNLFIISMDAMHIDLIIMDTELYTIVILLVKRITKKDKICKSFIKPLFKIKRGFIIFFI